MTWNRRADNSERDAQIYDDYKAGTKYKEMSNYWCLSIQRLQRIVRLEQQRRSMKNAKEFYKNQTKQQLRKHFGNEVAENAAKLVDDYIRCAGGK